MASSLAPKASESTASDALSPVVTIRSMVPSSKDTIHPASTGDDESIDWREKARRRIADIEAMAEATYKFVMANLAREKKEAVAAREKAEKASDAAAKAEPSETDVPPPSRIKLLNLLPPPWEPKQQVLKRKADDMQEPGKGSATAKKKARQTNKEKSKEAPATAKTPKKDKKEKEEKGEKGGEKKVE